jgi:hypothetical protein
MPTQEEMTVLSRRLRQVEAEQILDAARDGAKPEQIATSLGVTVRHVINVLDACRLVGLK